MWDPAPYHASIVLMMHFCDEVNVYEFLPSKRQTSLCHYYEDTFDQACTLGAYHPLLFEKNMVKHLSQGTDEDIYDYGKVTLPGLRKTQLLLYHSHCYKQCMFAYGTTRDNNLKAPKKFINFYLQYLQYLF
ncbi:hypothetical protein L345_09979 [Ophiophagus hannah]|uniref:beta-galactoside alpha-(2,6)-sialyltransferase n=1 Tax=Ophiophagus hannah TaxID=8665 RepID=V8NRD5_OPHHA|nr:hypothetical protein L345_09979 [Ophiophagus hannah]